MKGTILLAEDDRNLRRVLQATLTREGYEVAATPDGAAAAEWLDTQRADALITDIRMPKMDGLALFRRCRERHPELPVILITAFGKIEDAVEDTGAGIPEEDRSQLFRPFFTTRERGVGMGLAICRRIVEENGGSVSVETTPGRGSRFTVKLPEA